MLLQSSSFRDIKESFYPFGYLSDCNTTDSNKSLRLNIFHYNLTLGCKSLACNKCNLLEAFSGIEFSLSQPLCTSTWHHVIVFSLYLLLYLRLLSHLSSNNMVWCYCYSLGKLLERYRGHANKEVAICSSSDQGKVSQNFPAIC